MGIRFYCPNGHKLNVKAFQAGRRGICPYCGASMIIPTESTRPASKRYASPTEDNEDDHSAEPEHLSDDDDLLGDAGDNPPSIVLSSGQPVSQPPSYSPIRTVAPTIVESRQAVPVPTPISQAPSPISLPAQQAIVLPAVAPQPTSGPSPFNGSQADAPTGVVMPPTSATAPATPTADYVSSGDPLAEMPTAVWYVRPAAGGQYGPASGEVMRAWLVEGRVGVDSLVWREGWADWQEAGQVFPDMKQDDMAAFTSGLGSRVSPAPAVTVMPTMSASPVSMSTAMPATRRSRSSTGMIIAGLVVTVVVLLIVFLAILFHQPSTDHQPPSQPKDKADPAAKAFFLPDMAPPSFWI